MEEVLQDLGLTEAEVNVYITLLQHEELTASEISDKTGLNRTFTYDVLNSLKRQGLASHVKKNNKTYYQSADPAALLHIVKEKENAIKQVLPQLENLTTTQESEPTVQIYSSKKGIRTILNKALTADHVRIYGTLQRFQQIMPSYYTIWNARREKEDVNVKALTYEATAITNGSNKLLRGNEHSGTTTFVFNDSVVLTLWSSTPVAIHVENAEIRDNYVSFFKNIWKQTTMIYSGTEGIKYAFKNLLEDTQSVLSYGLSSELSKIYGEEFGDYWQKQRREYDIEHRGIAHEDDETRAYFDERKKKYSDIDIRYLDKTTCGPVCVNISDTQVVRFIFTTSETKVMVNQSEESISTYRKHFEKLWERAGE